LVQESEWVGVRRKIIKKARRNLPPCHPESANPQHLFVETLTALQQKSALTSTHLYKEKKIKRQEVFEILFRRQNSEDCVHTPAMFAVFSGSAGLLPALPEKCDLF
jgi:hypothetical protein